MRAVTVHRLPSAPAFPEPSEADPDGLLAVGGDLSEQRLVAAYAAGIFPWYGEGEPILWWSPDPRLVLYPRDLRVSRSLRRRLRKGRHELRFDTAFERVVERCARVERKGQSGTWITPDMELAYVRLHRSGWAHSVETWSEGRLVGGLYGISLGAAFFGESMFADEPDASKLALVGLVQLAERWELSLIDCQVATAHLVRCGATLIPRERFLAELARCLEAPTRRGPWTAAGGVDRGRD